jgi:hypothetical protein
MPRKDVRLALGTSRRRAMLTMISGKASAPVTRSFTMTDVSTESDLSNSDGAAHESGDDDAPDRLRRRIARQGPDGRMVEVLAARRGVTMRDDAAGAGGTGGGDSVLGIVLTFLMHLLTAVVLSILIDAAAEGRPWKVKAYRRHGPFARRIHSERLPAGVEPEERMAQLLDQFAPASAPDS